MLDGTDTAVLLHDFAQHLRRKNADVPDIYFTLLDAADISPSIILNQNAKAKERKLDPFQNLSGESFKDYIHMVLQHMALFEIWQKLASYPFPRLDCFYIQKTHTKFTLATRKFRRMRAFARYKNEIWCMD